MLGPRPPIVFAIRKCTASLGDLMNVPSAALLDFKLRPTLPAGKEILQPAVVVQPPIHTPVGCLAGCAPAQKLKAAWSAVTLVHKVCNIVDIVYLFVKFSMRGQ